jgi:hypothetical protein
MKGCRRLLAGAGIVNREGCSFTRDVAGLRRSAQARWRACIARPATVDHQTRPCVLLQIKFVHVGFLSGGMSQTTADDAVMVARTMSQLLGRCGRAEGERILCT